MIETCNLCGWSVELSDVLVEARKIRHEVFHGTARIQKRNTTQGVVEWI